MQSFMPSYAIQINKKVAKEALDDLFQTIRFRQTQIVSLLNLFGESHSYACPSIFIYGHTATGKTFALETIFELLKV